MIALRPILITALAAFTGSGQQSSFQQPLSQAESVPPASCPVTRRPAEAFIPPPPYPNEPSLYKDMFYVGTEKLWTGLFDSRIWLWEPHRPGHEQDLTQKIFWMRLGYDPRTEPFPKLTVTGRRLDGPAPPLTTMRATNAFKSPSAMVTGVYVPAPGCWEITGDYQGDKLSFVVWVEPARLGGR